MTFFKSNWFGLYWVGWLLMFIVPEIWAAIFRPSDTLSDETWGLEHLSITHPFDLSLWTPTHWVVAVIVWILFAWLSIHIPFGRNLP